MITDTVRPLLRQINVKTFCVFFLKSADKAAVIWRGTLHLLPIINIQLNRQQDTDGLMVLCVKKKKKKGTARLSVILPVLWRKNYNSVQHILSSSAEEYKQKKTPHLHRLYTFQKMHRK